MFTSGFLLMARRGQGSIDVVFPMLLSKTLGGASEYTPRLHIAYTSQVAGVVDHDRIAALCQDQGIKFSLLLYMSLSKSTVHSMCS